jgi:hypothetical protein
MERPWQDEATIFAERAGEQAPSAPETPPASEPAPAPEVKAEEIPTTPPPESVIGEGTAAVVVRTPDGKFAPAPDVKFEFTVGEKTYMKTPAELARMARDGVAGQHFAAEVKQYREEVPRLVEHAKTLEQELEDQRALNLELLSDEAQYLTRKEEFDRLNAPEERLRRLELERDEELRMQRASSQQARQQQAVIQYYTQEVKPVQDQLLTDFAEVPLEAKMGRIALDTAGMLENGIIPPKRLPEYKAYLDGPFREWVAQEAAKTKGAQVASREALEAELRDLRAKHQTSVQQVGRQMVPAGGMGGEAPPAPLPPPRTRDEAKQRIISRSWES